MTVGTISIPNVDSATAISLENFIKGISALSGISFTPSNNTQLAFNSRLTFEGDSITRGSNGPTYIQFVGYFTRGRFFMPFGYNQGFGGDTAAQMATATETGLVVATQPDVVVILAGTNDLSGSTDTPATIFANLRTMVTAYQHVAKRIVMLTVLPRIDPVFVGLGAGREEDRVALNALITAQTDIDVVNMEGIFDPNTMTIDNRTATDTTDVGLHPNYLGAMTIGQQVANLLNTFIDQTTDAISHSFDANNLIAIADNPQFNGFAGGLADGTLGVAPTDWTLDMTPDSGLTVTGTQTTLNGNNALQITVTGTNAAVGSDGTTPATALIQLRNVIDFPVTSPDAAGDVYQSWWDFTATDSEGLALLGCSSGNTCDMQIQSVNANTSYPATPFAGVARNSALSPTQASALVQPAEVVSNGTLTNVTSAFQLTFQAGAVCAGTYVIAAPTMFRVPLPH